MTEDLVSFRTSKLAKKKGFNIPVFSVYAQNGCLSTDETTYNFNCRRGYSAPMQVLLQLWLWDKHSWWIEVYVDDDGTFGYLTSQITIEGRFDVPMERGFETPQEALEKGLQHTLKLLS